MQESIVIENPQYRLEPIVFKKQYRDKIKQYLIDSPRSINEVRDCLSILDEFFHQSLLRYPDIRMAPIQTRGEMSMLSELYDEVVETEKALLAHDIQACAAQPFLH